jgi:hypothetical protein
MTDAADDPTSDRATDPPLSALRSQADVVAAARWSIDHALAARSRCLTWIDPDFSFWPIGDSALLDALTAWLRLPQRRLVLLAHEYVQIERQHPRFVAWRRNWAHAVDAWTPSSDNEVRLPSLLIDEQRLCLQVFDATHWRGRLSLDERAVRQWHDEIDALLQRCEAAFPVRTLGL